MNYRQILSNLFIAATVCVCGAVSVHAADIKVIANSSVGASSVSADELKGVFLATKTSLSDGSHVEPVLEKGGPVHEAFVKEYLGKTDAALQTYYRSLVFTGKASMPKDARRRRRSSRVRGENQRAPSGTSAPGPAQPASRLWK